MPLDAAGSLSDLRVPLGSRLETLERDRKRQHSVRIIDQCRIGSAWRASGPEKVEIVDHH